MKGGKAGSAKVLVIDDVAAFLVEPTEDGGPQGAHSGFVFAIEIMVRRDHPLGCFVFLIAERPYRRTTLEKHAAAALGALARDAGPELASADDLPRFVTLFAHEMGRKGFRPLAVTLGRCVLAEAMEQNQDVDREKNQK